MNWKKVSIKTNEKTGDLISSVLVDAGASGVEIKGGLIPKTKGDEYGEDIKSDPETTIIAYYGESGFEETLNKIKLSLLTLSESSGTDKGSLELSVDEVEDKDWNENFKKNFTTFRAAGNIIIKPTWEKYDKAPEEIVIEMDPGMAFGSGVHETTKMCLQLLQKYKPENKGWSLMDVGCGSGILGIAGAKLGAGTIISLDYDSVSVEVTRENAERNGVELEAIQSDLLENAQLYKFDIVFANIIADIIIRLNGSVKEYMKNDAVYIISGIIDDRLDDVLESLKINGFRVMETLKMADWRALAVRK